MVILTEKVDKEKLMKIEETTYFEEMMKCVVDIDREIVAVNASLHSDLEEITLQTLQREQK